MKDKNKKNVPSRYHLRMGMFPSSYKMQRSLVLGIKFMKLYQNCQCLTKSFCNLTTHHSRMDWGARF